jgi:REP element-mobilizing transposase RayT
LGDIVGTFKSLTTVRYTQGVKTDGWPAFRERLWQRNYYEEILRGNTALLRVRDYIAENPHRWTTDPENPAALARSRV